MLKRQKKITDKVKFEPMTYLILIKSCTLYQLSFQGPSKSGQKYFEGICSKYLQKRLIVPSYEGACTTVKCEKSCLVFFFLSSDLLLDLPMIKVLMLQLTFQ